MGNIKGKKVGASAPEFEYLIPLQDGRELRGLCEHKIRKHRYNITTYGSFPPANWVVDVFQGNLEGLIIAEIELEREGQEIQLPS